MNQTLLHILLTDDDSDDCMLFEEVLNDLALATSLTIAHDGEQCMKLLNQNQSILPNVLFLDLNMPRKNGYECLSEIKLIDRLKNLPVIIFSTSLNHDVVDMLYQNGANYYIRKPGDFNKLKNVISKAVTLISQNEVAQPVRDKFILQA